MCINEYRYKENNNHNIALTERIDGSRLRSMGLMMMKTCWFLCVYPVGSRRAALQKYCTHPCLPRNVEGSPKGRPSLNGKLWIPGDRRTGACPEIRTRTLRNLLRWGQISRARGQTKITSYISWVIFSIVKFFYFILISSKEKNFDKWVDT